MAAVHWRNIRYYLSNTRVREQSFATTWRAQSNIDLASIATAHRHMRLIRLSLTDFRNYAALTWRPARADQRAVRPERQRQDQPAGGGLAAGSRPRPARRAQRRSAAARRPRRLGRRRALRHRGGRGGHRHRHAAPAGPARPDRRACSAWTAPRRAARRRSPPASPRSGSRRRWIGCSRRARPAAGASSTAWSGRWSPAMRARWPRTTPPWRSATACWRTARRCRPGWPAWRTPWRATPSPPPRRGWPWSRG